tara:strand:- start:3669 stop:4370 length:702 start_codon:yes stop_codon:yes gene_type:complete
MYITKIKTQIQNMSHLPKILQDIVTHLKTQNISISENVEGEGRGGSLKDEGTVKQCLFDSEFKEYIIDTKARKFGDMIVKDYNNTDFHVVNIKTSKMSSSDNCFSKAGVVYALTDLPYNSNYLGPMNLKQMVDRINTFKADKKHKDYYFLCIDKNNNSNVFCRGSKTINNWKVNINPSNILQIDWKNEECTVPIERTWDEVYDVLVNQAKKSTMKFMSNLPQEWLNDFKSSNL